MTSTTRRGMVTDLYFKVAVEPAAGVPVSNQLIEATKRLFASS